MAPPEQDGVLPRRYDVALSFAGEDRQIARALAEGLVDAGIATFYDEFESSDLWGEHLGEKLQRVYADEARFVIPLVSQHYARKVWPRHEFRSALDRAIATVGDAYILPIRLDDQELAGLSTSLGYVDGRTTSIRQVIDFVREKLGMASAGGRLERTRLVIQMNRFVPCEVFLVDDRVVVNADAYTTFESRLLVTFGENITHTASGSVLAPPRLDGSHVLGVHLAMSRGRRLCLTDSWYTAEPFEGPLSEVQAIAAARKVLSAFSDRDYVFACREDGATATYVSRVPGGTLPEHFDAVDATL